MIADEHGIDAIGQYHGDPGSMW